MLRQRLIGAALGLPMLFLLLWLNWYFRQQGSPDDLPLLGIATIIAGASGWEISHVVRHRFPQTSRWNGVYAALILPFLVHAIRLAVPTGGPTQPVSSLGLLIDSLGATMTVMLLFLGVWTDVERRGKEGLRENLYVLGGALYLGACLAPLLLLGETPMHEVAVAFVFLAVFALDTAAYFGGKRFGGVLMAPQASPHKTWSGAVCGLLGAITLTTAFGLLPAESATASWWNMGAYLSWWQLAMIGACIGVVGQIGDLLESLFKRWGGVKDAGTVIPGHGGFLDRFDSLFLAAPICYLLVTTFLRLPR